MASSNSAQLPTISKVTDSKKAGQTKSLAPWKSLVAGATAGAVEGFVTYPFEYAKTMMQFAPSQTGSNGQKIIAQRNPFVLVYTTASTRGITALYTGCTSLIGGTGLKAAIRFLAFDSIKASLVDENGKLSSGRGVIAGMGAGVLESVFAVTPFETIKTALIEDGKRAHPRYRGLVHGSMSLVRERGLGGIYRGLAAVTIRQGANSAVRMGSYSWLKTLVQSRQTNTNASLGSITTFGLGAVAGVITVYTTMPFDTVKTRMQSLAAEEDYRNTLDCAMKIVRNEGVKAFWSGSTARLARLVFSGGIVFTIYERLIEVLRPL